MRRDSPGQTTLAFFDAYFSNFVEGTEFLVSEAVEIVFEGRIPQQHHAVDLPARATLVEIVFEGRIPQQRPADAHDVNGTWRIVSDQAEMRRTTQDPEALMSLLRGRHRRIMSERAEMGPGEFKVALPTATGAWRA